MYELYFIVSLNKLIDSRQKIEQLVSGFICWVFWAYTWNLALCTANINGSKRNCLWCSSVRHFGWKRLLNKWDLFECFLWDCCYITYTFEDCMYECQVSLLSMKYSSPGSQCLSLLSGFRFWCGRIASSSSGASRDVCASAGALGFGNALAAGRSSALGHGTDLGVWPGWVSHVHQHQVSNKSGLIKPDNKVWSTLQSFLVKACSL